METINTKKSKVVTRSYTSDEEVTASSFPRSSFSNTYHNAFDGIIGRLIPAAVFDVLPKSSFRGNHSGAIQLERMVTPLMPDTTAHSYTFYCSCRAVDRDYMDVSAPSQANGMVGAQQYPCFDPAYVLRRLFKYIVSQYSYQCDISNPNYQNWLDLLRNYKNMDDAAKLAWYSENTGENYVIPSACLKYWPSIYLSGLAADFDQYFESYFDSNRGDASVVDCIYHTLVRFLEYAFGNGSVLDFLGYPIADFTKLNLLRQDNPTYWESLFYSTTSGNVRPLCNEYRLRMNAAIWIEYFRQPQLQPLTTVLRYNHWDSTPILGTTSVSDINFMTSPQTAMLLLFMRAVPFSEDRVTTAHVDNICRNVYAPVLNTSAGKIATTAVNQISGNQVPDFHNGLQTVSLQYRNNVGMTTSINCPVPSSIGNFMNGTTGVPIASTSTLMLDLQNLRTAERLERELKRRYWFGDSYFDVVRADYDCDISDADVLKPHLLFDGDVSVIGANQEVANTSGSDDSPRGTRTAVAQGDYPNDSYSGFAQETGCVISLFYLSQRVSYNPADDFNFVRTYSDMIRPMFAGTNESIMHKFAVNRHAINGSQGYGYEPYGNYYRTRLDRAHGKFLREYRDYIALRDPQDIALTSDFNQQYQLPLGHFADTVMLDGQFYVLATHEFYVTHSLPAPVEII